MMTKKKEPTITVEGWFGKDKDITRADYVKLWADNATLYRLIDYSQLSYMEAWAKSIKDDIAELAGYSWDIGYNRKLKKEEKK